MRGAWKYITLLGGLAGLAGFVLPFVTFRAADNSVSGSVSAYQIIKGIDSVGELMSGVTPALASNAELQTWGTQFNASMADYRGALVAFFLPAVLLALLGALTGVRHKMGRIAGLAALLFGAANAGVWALFSEVSARQSSSEVVAAMGLGLHMLLVAGCAGMLAGLGALLAPDRGHTAGEKPDRSWEKPDRS